MLKAPVKFQKDRTKTVGGVKGTRYLLKIRNHAPCATRHAPRKAENSVPPLFFEKAGDNKAHFFQSVSDFGPRKFRLTDSDHTN